MSIQETLEIFDCIQNLDYSRLLSYLCKNPERIRQAAGVAVDVIKYKQALDELLRCWGTVEIQDTN